MECGDAVLDSEGAAERKSVYDGGNYIITALCLRCGECVNNCNDQVIAPGDPPEQWPTFYINRDDCVSCAACVPACPYGAIFRESDVPAAYVAKGGEVLNRPGLRGYHTVRDAHGQRVRLNTTCRLKPGQVVDLTVDIQGNYDFFDIGPGYSTQELLAPGWIDISEPIYASDESFEDIVIDSAMPVLVMYYAAWCPPSQMLMPVIKVIAYDYSGDLGVILIDMDQNPRWAQYYGITSTPTLLFFSQGELKSRFDLALPESMLRKAVDQFLCTLG